MENLIFEHPLISPFSEFDRLFEVMSDPNFKPTNKQKSCICSTQFPHSDIYEDDDKNLKIEVTLPGWSEDELKADFKNDYFILKGKKEPAKESRKWIQRGIKQTTEFEVQFFVDPRRYDANGDKVKFSLEKGILNITFPRNAAIIENQRYSFGKLVDAKKPLKDALEKATAEKEETKDAE